MYNLRVEMLDYVEVVCKSMKVIILYLASESGRNCHTHQWEFEFHVVGMPLAKAF